MADVVLMTSLSGCDCGLLLGRLGTTYNLLLYLLDSIFGLCDKSASLLWGALLLGHSVGAACDGGSTVSGGSNLCRGGRGLVRLAAQEAGRLGLAGALDGGRRVDGREDTGLGVAGRRAGAFASHCLCLVKDFECTCVCVVCECVCVLLDEGEGS
jgi:hypothetical protein